MEEIRLLKTWEATIKLPNKLSHKTSIQAETMLAAKDLLEALYGKKSLLGMPTEIKRISPLIPKTVRN
jgi:hypothetical protein